MLGSANARDDAPMAVRTAANCKRMGAMNRIVKAAMGAVMMAGAATAGTLAATETAQAGVHIGIGLGIPGPGPYRYEGYYGPGYYPPGPCAYYNYYYSGYCGYPVYNDPV